MPKVEELQYLASEHAVTVATHPAEPWHSRDVRRTLTPKVAKLQALASKHAATGTAHPDEIGHLVRLYHTLHRTWLLKVGRRQDRAKKRAATGASTKHSTLDTM
jgi:hypothetical protein